MAAGVDGVGEVVEEAEADHPVEGRRHGGVDDGHDVARAVPADVDGAQLDEGGGDRAIRRLQLDHLMILLMIAMIFAFALGPLAVTGVVAVVLLLTYEHSLVSKDDLSKLNAAFFTMNGWVSVLFFVFWAADIFLHPQHI